MPERVVNVQVQVAARTILDTPEKVMEQLSFKVFQRRDKLIAEMLGKRVTYELDGEYSGILERIDGSTAYVAVDDKARVRVSVKRLRL